jgi:YVTN family beta-propeller protein
VDFGILGPLEVHDESRRRLPLGGRQQRALLALLLLHANEIVAVDEIIDELWHSEPPPSATKSVHALVSKLRRTLEGGGRGVGEEGENGVVLTHGHGYVLRVAPGELDLDRFQSLLTAGRRAFAEGRLDIAADTLRDALSLWRGSPLAEFAYDSFAQVEIGRLEELRLSALEERVEADLALARHHELIPELESLAAENPLRERLHAQLMLALYRSGRQGEALEAYQRTRRVLVDELGIDPGQALQRLEKAILVQDPSLEIAQQPVAPLQVATAPAREADAGVADAREPPSVPVPTAIERRRPSRLPLIAVLGVVLAVVAAGGVYLVVHGGPATTTVQPNSVGIIDPASNKIVGEVPVGARPGQVVAAAGGIWVANLEDRTVTRLDPTTQRLVRTISTEDAPIALTASDRFIWAVSASFTLPYATIVRKIDPRVNDVVETTRLEGSSYPGTPGGGAAADRRGELRVVTCCLGLVSRIERGTTKVVSRIATGGISPGSVAVGAGATWVADTVYNEVARIAPTNVVVATIPVGRTPSAIAVGAGGVWVAVSGENVVRRIDPVSNVIMATIPVGRLPGAIAVAADAVWVANGGDGTVSRIDPDTNRVAATVRVGGSPQGIALAAGRVWVTVQAGGGAAAVSPGGTLHVTSQEEPDSLDPALAREPLSWQLEYATCAKLLNYPDRAAPQGSLLVPEVARSMPAISPDRKTYTFTIRQGFRFSPPSRAAVNAQTFKFAIERGLKLPPRLYGEADDIVGATAYATGKAPHVAGIAAAGNRLTIRLSKPSPWFLEELAEPLFCAVPIDTPVTPRGVPVLPAAGPYYFASHHPGREIVLKRNPNYTGDRPHRLQEIRVTIGVSPGQSIEQIEAGNTDYTLDYGLAAGAHARLASRYGPGSPAARAGRQRYFLSPAFGLDYLVLNTSRPLFTDVKLRQAVNYAIDRHALARLGFSPTTPAPAVPTDQYLIPGARGFRDARIYPFSPDVATARRLAGGKHPKVVFYNCTTANCREHGAIIEENLEAAGFRVEVKEFPLGVLVGKLNNPRAKHEPFDLAVGRAFHGTPDPFDFLNWLLDAKLGANGGLFDDVDASRRLERAAMMTGPHRDRTYGELDIDLARNTAPVIAFSYQTRQDFFSARTGCQVYVPTYGMDLAALCIRR